jgi:cell division protein FtsB
MEWTAFALNRLGRLTLFLSWMLLLTYLLYHLVEGRLGLRGLSSLKTQCTCLAQDVRNLRARKTQLGQRVRLLRDTVDPDLLEEQVKHHLGYVWPHEYVIFDKPTP